MDQEDRIYTSKGINLYHYHGNMFQNSQLAMVMTQPKVIVWSSQIMTLKSPNSTESMAILLLFSCLCLRLGAGRSDKWEINAHQVDARLRLNFTLDCDEYTVTAICGGRFVLSIYDSSSTLLQLSFCTLRIFDSVTVT